VQRCAAGMRPGVKSQSKRVLGVGSGDGGGGTPPSRGGASTQSTQGDAVQPLPLLAAAPSDGAELALSPMLPRASVDGSDSARHRLSPLKRQAVTVEDSTDTGTVMSGSSSMLSLPSVAAAKSLVSRLYCRVMLVACTFVLPCGVA
jgi:hypothetical protein